MAGIHWFRKGLRLHDNPALADLCNQSDISAIYPVFILDPFFVEASQKTSPLIGVNRWKFLLECLDDLDKNLKTKNSKLFVFRGDPIKIIPALAKSLKAKCLSFEKDTEPYALLRDQKIETSLENICKVKSFVSHTLFDPKTLLKPSLSDFDKKVWKHGIPPLTYVSFIKTALGSESNGNKVALPIPDIKTIPSDILSTNDLISLLSKESITKEVAGPKSDFSVPEASELNIEFPAESKASPHKGGESVALARLSSFISDKNRVLTFQKPETAPTAYYPSASTTILSPYLKFGALSCRLFHQELWKIESANRDKASKPPVSLRGQLMWRDFFYTCAYATPHFDNMKENPICLQIPWKCQKKGDTHPHLEAWKEGRTGFPWIDAVMTQLRKEGWIHHLARHAVACFLTRGDLYISWERGAEVFEELLLDADWSLNSANWLWLSASAFYTQYFRVYSPIAFPKKTDPNGDYVKHWLPVLKNFPQKFIYEPWTAPMDVQRRANCIIGKDYPKPIIDHADERKTNLAKMKEAYQSGDYGCPSGMFEDNLPKRKNRS